MMRNRIFIPYRNRQISMGFDDGRSHQLRGAGILVTHRICPKRPGFKGIVLTKVAASRVLVGSRRGKIEIFDEKCSSGRMPKE